VSGLIRGEESPARSIFRPVINEFGVVRGNSCDAVADNTLPVHGSVDTSSQRVARWTGEKQAIVFKAGQNIPM
jgi:hypothetical protein